MSTMKRVGIFVIASLFTLTGISVASGQQRDRAQKRWGSGAMPHAGVCLFQDSDFHGPYFCVDANDDIGTLPEEMRDRISSLRVIGGVSATVFKDEKFKGPSGRFLTDVRDLRKQGWGDRISSIRVTRAAAAWDSARPPAWGRTRRPAEGACFYRDAGFKGDYFCMPRGGSYATVPEDFNDKISSIRVMRAGGVLIFGDRDFDGKVVPFMSDVADLKRSGWGDKISSIRVF